MDKFVIVDVVVKRVITVAKLVILNQPPPRSFLFIP